MEEILLQFKDALVYLLIAATMISVIAWFIERAQGTSSEPVPFDAIVIINPYEHILMFNGGGCFNHHFISFHSMVISFDVMFSIFQFAII